MQTPNIRIKWELDMRLLVVTIALAVALFFYALRYLTTRDHLIAVCKFVESQAVRLQKPDSKNVAGLEEAVETCVDAEVISANN